MWGKELQNRKGDKFQAKGALETKEWSQNMNRKKTLNSSLEHPRSFTASSASLPYSPLTPLEHQGEGTGKWAIHPQWVSCPEKPSKIRLSRTSPVIWWLGVCLPMQGTWVESLVLEDSIDQGAAEPVCHSYWSLRALGPMLRSNRSHWDEKPPHCSWRKAHT